ncbi:MAG: hypothetical protein J6B37_07960 [Clostridia bacterium]|nr:hypothetical protein [Clostridia bacterium]
MLRKADFSIQEIKALQMGGETAQQTVKEYINRTNEKIRFNSEIIEKIGTLANEENITVEIICERLSTNLADEKVPTEDMELSPKEQKEKHVFTAISVIGMVLSCGSMILILLLVVFGFGYKYTEFLPYDTDFVRKLIFYPIQYFFLIQFVLCLIIYLFCKKKKKIGKKKDRKKALCIFITILWVISLLFSPFAFLLHLIAGYCSITSNPNNYLVVDEEYLKYEWEEIFQVFPYKMPDSVKQIVYSKNSTTKYFYAYSDEFLDAYRMDIYAEWQLDHNTESIYESDYEKEKQRILSKDNIVCIESMGDWQCVHFKNKRDVTEAMCDYEYLFFAYNDETHTVRYIAEFGYKTDPYHLQLDW